MNTLRPLLDLFRHHREKSTGHWRLGQDPGRVVYFDSGDIVFAQSSFPQDRLTQILVERGKLTQAQLDYALGNLKPGMSIGKNLIEMGFITQRDLLEVARLQVERVVAGALGVSGLDPTFEAKDELEASIVRLPMDTAGLLLNGLLALQDRERILELLGPLNQVVVLQGRRLQELTLPADLSRLPVLLDGTHTLLELSREAGVEPIRLGIFALFLREMGWARLHELPPVDRGVLDLALEAEPEVRPLGLQSPLAEAGPALFATIQDASRPTTNLEHLSQALDELDLPEEDDSEGLAPEAELLEEELPEPTPPEPVNPGFQVESGQVILPPPGLASEGPSPVSTRDLDLELAPASLQDLGEPEPPALDSALPTAASRPSSLRPVLLGGLLLACAAGLFYWKLGRRPGVKPPTPVSTKAADHSPAPAKPAPEAAPKATPEAAPPTVPAKANPPAVPTPAVDFRVDARLEALLRGDLERALQQGALHRKGLEAGAWVLRLEIACMGETLRRAVEFFQPAKPDLFILPLVMRDGRTCYQVLLGSYSTRAEAEAQVAKLPSAFRQGGNRPRAYRVSEIPERQ